MDPNQSAAINSLELSEKAFKRGDKELARQYAVQAAGLAPELEEVWLMMAALAAPRASLKFFQQALQINPQSERAQKGLADAQERLGKDLTKAEAGLVPLPIAVESVDPQSQTGAKRSRLLYAALLIPLLCLIAAVIITGLGQPDFSKFNPLPGILSAPQMGVSQPGDFPSLTPASANAILASSERTNFTSTESFTLAPSPTALFTPTHTSTVSPTLLSSATPSPSATVTPTFVPSEIPTEAVTPTALPSDTPEPTLEPLPTQPIAARPATSSASSSSTSGTSGGKHWIDVDLTNQMVYAYEGDTLVNSFLVSTGATPRLTVTGSFHIYERHVTANMWGPGYFLPDVPYTMYFYKGFALHGTYWHSNFGTPMSHGCVNLSIPDAEWLYYWSSWGTPVKVHY